MALFTIYVLLFTFFSAAYAAPMGRRDTFFTSSSCQSWAVLEKNPYELQSNLWGENSATSGSQCTKFTAMRENTISWSTSWAWTGGFDVKSYSNIKLSSGKQLSAISSIPSTWKWSQSSSGPFVADVSYDMFTSSTPTGNNEHEVMVWTANFNYGPISDQYTSCGNAIAIVEDIKLGGRTWNLYKGNNGENIVWSFLPADGAIINSFKGDINLFLKYLTSQGYVPSAQYLKTVQGGTEAVSGAATFTTSAYRVEVN